MDLVQGPDQLSALAPQIKTKPLLIEICGSIVLICGSSVSILAEKRKSGAKTNICLGPRTKAKAMPRKTIKKTFKSG